VKIRGLVLDWDGVWTNGRKRHDGQSDFSEHDTMGLNLLRFAHFAQTGEVLRIALITGERNPTAEHVVQREHFDHFLYYARDKTKAIPILEQSWGIKASDWGFVFDDVLDLELAAKVGRRAMVQWPATQAIQDIATREGLVDDWIPADSPPFGAFAKATFKNRDGLRVPLPTAAPGLKTTRPTGQCAMPFRPK
jgi:3-deoxy-D-manno-octulosonate 8-phosphate phosphatase (KDO 8-P phosphatase)